MDAARHPWRFFRAGGAAQVRLTSSDDLRHLRSLDRTLWAALAMPVAGVAGDRRTLALLDADGDGRVRADDILDAVDFVVERLREPADALTGTRALPLDALRDDTAAGRAVRAAADLVLSRRPGVREVTVDDVADPAAAFAAMPLNGDGTVVPSPDEDVDTRLLIEAIQTCIGSVPDRSGAPGVDRARVDAFFAACADFQQARADAAALPAPGEAALAAACAAIDAARPAVDDYFARTRILAFDARAAAALDVGPAAFEALAHAPDLRALEALPLARLDPAGALPLRAPLNPAWQARIDALRDDAVVPLIGPRDTIGPDDWRALDAAVAPYRRWQDARKGQAVEPLGLARVEAWLRSDRHGALLELIARDLARKPEADAVDDLVRLVHYHAHLGVLLRNFVNFADFYGRTTPAAFQAGCVYLDTRRYDLVLPVLDAARHSAMAARSGIYLLYLDCTRRGDGGRRAICVAVTDGDDENLIVGRNGLHYDREGRVYDATITRIVTNPISVRQAFGAPYRKLMRSVEGLVTRRASEAEARSGAALDTAVEKVAAPPTFDVGTVAALGVAVGGITAALGAVLTALFGLGWGMPLGVLAVVACISGPSMLLAALTLRRRNLGPLLDADGWAVNAPARIPLRFGRSLTRRATLPPGAVVQRGVRSDAASP